MAQNTFERILLKTPYLVLGIFLRLFCKLRDEKFTQKHPQILEFHIN